MTLCCCLSEWVFCITSQICILVLCLWAGLAESFWCIVTCCIVSRCNSGTMMEILIRQYQLWVGLQNYVLEDTTPCPWVPDHWLKWVWHTLHEHNIQIQYDNWKIPPLQRHNTFLMEAVSKLGLTSSQLEQINACRMYLCVTTLVEIVNHTGTTILLQVIILGPMDHVKGLDEISTLTLQWPHIHLSTKATWRLWMKTICNLFTGWPNRSKLNHPLGEWTNEYQVTQHWNWHISPSGHLLNKTCENPCPRAAILISKTRTHLQFSPIIPTVEIPVRTNKEQFSQRFPVLK